MDDAKAEKLALARKKLREFEIRRQNEVSPVPSFSSSHDVPNGRNSSVSTQSGTANEESLENPTQSSHQEPPVDMVNAKKEVKESENEQLKKQLADLHGHYSQLHAAYSRLIEGNNGIQSDSTVQVVQLQMALALNVEEKTKLQSSLRDANFSISQLTNELSAAKEREWMAERERESRGNLEARLAESERLLAGRQEELSGARKEAADLQAANRTLNQDKSEAQARLRAAYKEKEGLERVLTDTRKDLAIKEMHIRQLSAHGNSLAGGVGTDRLQELQDEVSRLQEEKGRAVKAEEEARLQWKESEQRNADTIRHLSDSLARLQSELEEKSLECVKSASRQSIVEAELECALAEMKRLKEEKEKETQPPSSGLRNGDSSAALFTQEEVTRQVDETAKRLSLAFEERILSEDEMHRRSIEQLNNELERRDRELVELQLKKELSDEKQRECDHQANELGGLLQQLQNEKATVSRALSQNRELKEQVVELEERLVTLTEEKLHAELARQRAEHNWREMQKSQEGPDGESAISPSPAPASSPSLEVHCNGGESSGMEEAEAAGERERTLIEQLAHSSQQLEQVRAALVRSENQKEEMNQIMRQNAEDENQNSILVELSQAMTRVNELAEHNALLRDEKAQLESLVAEWHTERESLLEMNSALREEIAKTRISEEGRAVDWKDPPVMNGSGPERAEEGEGDGEVAKDEETEREAETRLRQLESENAHLEHVNVQLQLENETIADHVVLYQHQRRLIRERLRLRDDQLRAAEQERARVAARCEELQAALTTLLSQRNLSLLPLSTRKRRSYSQSKVDETSGDEEVIVAEEDIPSQPPDLHNYARSSGPNSKAIKRILEIITDIKTAPAGYDGRMLHCTQCIGDTIIV